MPTAFEDYVNTELPKRLAIATAVVNAFVRFTGIGKQVEARTPAQVLADIGGASNPHTSTNHSGKIGEVPWGPLRIVLKKALPAATNNASLDDDWVYKSPWTNEAVRINNWYIRFESNLAAQAIFELRKNGTVITGSSITVAASARDAA